MKGFTSSLRFSPEQKKSLSDTGDAPAVSSERGQVPDGFLLIHTPEPAGYLIELPAQTQKPSPFWQYISENSPDTGYQYGGIFS